MPPNNELASEAILNSLRTEGLELLKSSGTEVTTKLSGIAPKCSEVTKKLSEVEPKFTKVTPEYTEVSHKHSEVTPKLAEEAPKLADVEPKLSEAAQPETEASKTEYKPRIIWVNVFFITLFHAIAVYTFFFKLYQLKILSILYGYIVGQVGGFGVTGGAHRLWAHKSYKATWPLKIILLFCYSVAGQNTVYDWVRDHRVHHKFSETDADPHNSNRGFFFAHVGWLMQRKHPEVYRRGVQVDMSDILQDPILTFHTKYFTIIKLVCCFILPPLIPIYCWNEDITLTILGMCFVRYVMGLNFTWLVNSAAHIYGNKPYDKRINPVENLSVAIVAMGEGWHNYHHVFPWDYKAAELGNYKYNYTTALIDMFARIGWAYDLKYASPSLVKSVMQRHGDGSHFSLHDVPEQQHHDVPEPQHQD